MDKNALFDSYFDCKRGKWSMSEGDIDVWYTEDRELYVVDGYHRMVKYIFQNRRKINVYIEGVGYSPNWKIPKGKDRFRVDTSLKYFGLDHFGYEDSLDRVKAKMHENQA